MQKTRANIPVYLMIIPVIASCVLRFFQLLDFTDKKTGNVIGGGQMSLAVYILLAAAIILDFICVKKKSEFVPLLDFEKGGKAEYAVSAFLAIAYFADFVHQAYNCYSYVSKMSYIEYAYLIPMAISGILALLSCFYFVCFAMTAGGSNYDFRNFTLFHFIPVIWCFSKLIMMMLKIIDVKQNVEGVLEFLLMVFMIMFFFCYISMVDNKGKISRVFVFFSNAVLIIAAVLVLPRYAIMISGNFGVLSPVDYTGVTYLAAGIFAVTLSKKALKTND